MTDTAHFVDRRRRAGRRQGRRDAARRGLRRAPWCCSAPSPTVPTSGRRCPRGTCRAPPSATPCSCTPRLVRRATTSTCGSARAVDRARPARPPSSARRARGAAATTTSCCSPPARRPRRLPVPGAELAGRPLPAPARRQRRAQRAAFTPGVARSWSSAAGWIGLEAAAAARGRGQRGDRARERSALPLLRVARRRRSATVFADLHRDHGVGPALRGQRRRGPRPARTRHGGARRSSGTARCSTPTWSSSASASPPNVELARSTPALDVDDGVLVDAHLRTSRPRHRTPPVTSPTPTHPLLGRRLRVEHWANALNQPAGRRPDDARQRGRLRPAAVLLHRPVRPRHGVLGLRRPGRYDEGRVRGDLGRPGVHRASGCARAGCWPG